jgi:hypothetical protein
MFSRIRRRQPEFSRPPGMRTSKGLSGVREIKPTGRERKAHPALQTPVQPLGDIVMLVIVNDADDLATLPDNLLLHVYR